MTLVAELRLDSPILRASLSAVPEMRLTYLQETVRDGAGMRLFFRAEGDDFEAFEAGMAEDPTVAEYARLTDTPERRLYRITATEAAAERSTYPEAVKLDAPILDATGTTEGWLIRIEFPGRDALCAYRSACEERDVSFEVRRLYGSDSDGGDATRLTPVQREVLEAALERGYFEIPRRVSLNDLGEELDISGQAVSERLRRALGKAALETLRHDDSSRTSM